jgi:predicted nucleic-acid-binding protein
MGAALTLTGIDTNILIRYLTQDDEQQSPLANEVFAAASPSKRIYISNFVLLETIWVLRSVYEVDFGTIAENLRKLCESPSVAVQDPGILLAVLESGFDKHYMDAFVVKAAELKGCTAILTFDTRLAKRMESTTLLR